MALYLGFLPVPPLLALPRTRLGGETRSIRRGTAIKCAQKRDRRSENVLGDMYVDSACIDCDTCRWFAPGTFKRANGQSAVHSQPSDEGGRHQALMAAAACPTGSIHSTTSQSSVMKEGAVEFPMSADRLYSGMPATSGIYYLGMTNQKSFGASSWLVLNGDAGFMVDVPRYSRALAARIRDVFPDIDTKLKYIIFTHMDDVAGHEQWAAEFPSAKRIIHADEANASQGTDACEIQVEEHQFPYTLESGNDVGIELIAVPGHTKGCIAILHKKSKSLFTGDHICYSHTRGNLVPSRALCFHSWEEQTESVRKLIGIDFLHAWPGHGGHIHFTDDAERRRRLSATVALMEKMR